VTPEGALIVCRVLFDAAVIWLWGASAYLGFVVPAGLARHIDQVLRPAHVAAIVTAVAATAAMLPLRAATIGNGWVDAFSPDMLHGILLETDVGLAWMLQASAVVFLIAATALSAYRRLGQAVGAALLLISLTTSGHAAMNSGWLRIAHRLNDAVHLLAGGAWLGALVPVLLILPMLGGGRLSIGGATGADAFFRGGHVAVALVIVSGILNTLLIVRTVPFDWVFGYQRLLSAKILLVGIMVLIAIVNRYVFVPRLGRGSSLRALISCIIAEIGSGWLLSPWWPGSAPCSRSRRVLHCSNATTSNDGVAGFFALTHCPAVPFSLQHCK
jgi:putative copper resistance protein D